MAQAKRSDGGVLKVEQPGGPLAVEEFIKGDNSFGFIMGAIQTIKAASKRAKVKCILLSQRAGAGSSPRSGVSV